MSSNEGQEEEQEEVDEVVSQIKPGDVIDSYVVDAKLGAGGMGAVFKGRHRETMFLVAIKILFGRAAYSQDLTTRFRREASAANLIGHIGFVRAIHFGVYQGRPYLVMELLQGRSLSDETKQAPLPIARAARILIQAADALQAAHTAGVVHRDIKPDNIFVLPGDTVRILDLGIAKFVKDSAAAGGKTRTNSVMGTPQTMSPEQCRGSNVDHRSDIYSLGVVAYRILSGRWPLDGAYWGDILAAHITREPTRLDEVATWVPASLADVVQRCLQKDPAQRFQQMDELKLALSPFMESSALVIGDAVSNARTVSGPLKPLTTHSSSSGEVSLPPATTRSARGLVAVAATVIAGLVGVTSYVLLDKGPSDGKQPVKAVPAVPKEAEPVVAPPPKPAVVPTPSPAADPAPPATKPDPPPEQPPPLQKTDESPSSATKPDDKPVATPSGKAKPGTLSVDVTPWANVSVDGGKATETPVVVKLSAGSHRVVITNPALNRTKELTVTIQGEKTKRLSFDFNKPE